MTMPPAEVFSSSVRLTMTRSCKGEVVAVGNGKILENGETRKLDLKVGDKILFGKYSGTEVKVDGTDLLVMREDDIMAVFDA